MSVQNAFSDFELLNGRQLSNVYMNNAIRTYIEYLKIHVGKYEKCDFGTELKKLQKTFQSECLMQPGNRLIKAYPIYHNALLFSSKFFISGPLLHFIRFGLVK